MQPAVSGWLADGVIHLTHVETASNHTAARPPSLPLPSRCHSPIHPFPRLLIAFLYVSLLSSLPCHTHSLPHSLPHFLPFSFIHIPIFSLPHSFTSFVLFLSYSFPHSFPTFLPSLHSFTPLSLHFSARSLATALTPLIIYSPLHSPLLFPFLIHFHTHSLVPSCTYSLLPSLSNGLPGSLPHVTSSTSR